VNCILFALHVTQSQYLNKLYIVHLLMTDIFRVNRFLVSVSISVSVSCSRVSTTSPEYSGISSYTVSGKDVAADVDVCSFRRYKAYVNIRRGLLVRWCQITVRSSKMWVFRSLYLPYEVPTGCTYQNLHGFTRFSGDSMALCIIYIFMLCNIKVLL